MDDPDNKQDHTPPWQLRVPERSSVFVGELARRGHWTVANIATGIAWPVEAQRVVYKDQVFWIIPPTTDSGPAVAMRADRGNDNERQTQMMRFLSALSWAQGSGIRVSGFSGGSLPFLASRPGDRGYSLTGDFVVRDLPEPDAQGQLALALMREARSLDHAAYSFLTFYRVLEAAFPQGRLRGAWIANTLELLTGRAKEALKKLKARGIDDAGAHIHRTRRHAIAHAAQLPIMDPDDYSNARELYEEMPLISGLAECAIEDKLGILTHSTIYHQHLYELAGFRTLIPEGLMSQIMLGPWGGISGSIDLPLIDLELRRSAPFEAFRGLIPIIADITEGAMRLHYRSPDELVTFVFELHFDEERLVFDLDGGIRMVDDGSAHAARNVIDLLRFKLDYIGNGELHLFDAETRTLLSRVDAFIPLNCWANHEWFAAETAKWTAVAGEREAAEAVEALAES